MLKYSFLLLWCCQLFCQQIHVIYTSAMIQKDYDLRKDEYFKSLQQLRSFGFDPWIVEATNIDSSYFDQVSTRVLYPQKHDSSLRNKGVNETMSMRACLPYFQFDDDDIVIKITGRYFMQDQSFIDSIKATADEYDVWGVFGKHFNEKNDLFTGCYAMRWKYLKQIISEMDLEAAEKDFEAVEILFGKFIINEKLRVNKLNNLRVLARICIFKDRIYEF